MRDVKAGEIYIRPKEMFMSTVDGNKYPSSNDLFRFAKFN